MRTHFHAGCLVLASFAALLSGQSPSLERSAALAKLEAYTPTRSAPTEPDVIAATELLAKAMSKIVATADDPVHARLQQLLDERRGALAPTRQKPVGNRDPLAQTLLRYWDEQLQHTKAAEVRAEPGAAAFPGQAAAAPAVLRVVTIDLRVPGRHSLGLYAPPGTPITVHCTGMQPANQLQVRIGAHSDNIARRPNWPRLPRISRVFALQDGDTLAANAFGGIVYVEVGKAAAAAEPHELEVTVGGAIDAPLFLLGTTDPVAWRERIRLAPGPWAEIGTDKVILTVPSERIRNLDDPTAVLQFWNQVLDGAADLAARPHERTRPERYVADLEISAGAMHSGYPIMTHLGAAADMVDLDRMRKGPWGLFHELGHNHQQKDWTFDGTTEVTVNLFSLYLCETLCGLGPDRAWGGNVERARTRLQAHLTAGTSAWDGDGGKDLSLRLLMYSQMQREFGWATFTKVFAEYRDLPKADRPGDDAARRDQWLVRFSRATGRNLGPFFTAWGLATSPAARAAVADLPEWLPAEMRSPR